MEDLERTLEDARFTAIEAMFELFPFDEKAQKSFEDAIDSSN